MACSYCYEKDIDNRETIKDEEIELIINHIFMDINNSKIKNVDIEFTGGEPLLYFNVIKLIVESLKQKKCVNFSFSLITNGLLINETMLNFFEKHSFNIQISLDGYSKDHDLLRVSKTGSPTFNKIMKKVQLFLLNYNNIKLTLRINISNINYRRLDKIIDELNKYISIKERAGIFIYCDTVDVSNSNKNYIKPSLANESILKLYFLLFKSGYSIPENYIDGGLCMIKNNNSIAFEPNGNIIKCYSMVGNEISKIGKLNNDKDKSVNYPYNYLVNECKNKKCPVLFYCYGGCPYKEYVNTGNLTISCNKEKIFFLNKAFFILTLLREGYLKANNYNEFMELIFNVEILEIHK